MKHFAVRFLFCALVASLLSLNAWGQTKVGKIRAARVENLVEKVSADGVKVPVKNGDGLTEKDTIVTGPTGSVVLVFENGSSVKVGGGSSLAIEEFKVDPLDEQQEAANINAIKSEPTKSKTALNLSYGEMVGDVKKLNVESTYSVKTPVGAAGIRGTVFRIVFRPAANGKAFFTVSTAEGLVVMEGVSTQKISVPHDKEVVVEIDVPTDPKETPAPPKILSQDIPADVRAAITTAAESIATARDQNNFTVPATNEGAQPTPPPAPVETPPDLTPGAGK